MIVYARPPNAPNAYVFGDISFETPIWANGLHMISL